MTMKPRWGFMALLLGPGESDWARRLVRYSVVRPCEPPASVSGSKTYPTPGATWGPSTPGRAPFWVLVVIGDLDPGRFGLGTLRDRYFEHAILVRGLDAVVTHIGRKPEGPTNSAVVAFGAMNPRVLGACGLVALGVDHQGAILDLHLERVGLQTGQIDAEAIAVMIFDHIDRR